MRYKLMIGLFVTLLLISSCSVDYEKDCTVKEHDIIVEGCSSDGYIQNVGNNTVRIKAVWQYKGETTQWIKEFKPMQKHEMYINGHQQGLYIIDLNGTEIGFIRAGFQKNNMKVDKR